jgi:hypothetical protein
MMNGGSILMIEGCVIGVDRPYPILDFHRFTENRKIPVRIKPTFIRTKHKLHLLS